MTCKTIEQVPVSPDVANDDLMIVRKGNNDYQCTVSDIRLGEPLTQVVNSNTIIASQNTYIANKNAGGVLEFTLPTSCDAGLYFRIVGWGSEGWIIKQNAGQTQYIFDDATTTGTGGSIASTEDRDCVFMYCVVADTDFLVFSSQGNLIIT